MAVLSISLFSSLPANVYGQEEGDEAAKKREEILQKGEEIFENVGGQMSEGEGAVEKGTKGCLIATAAFGSELTPQVQFLRNFRDKQIMSTLAGSSFMNVFNTWYYSFSPYVADYEKEQVWLRNLVKTAIYPLIGILHISEMGYSSMQGEYGAMTAGLVASSMIGALYFWPFALSVRQVRISRFNYKAAVCVTAVVFAGVIGSILAGNEYALMISTSLFVLTMLSVSAVLSAKLIIIITKRRIIQGL